ncbi:hypothetical protein VTN00DRAFT_8429 [Thermoascus crustaceus]|uniref:uncharacterized protein n=1 Tax=Thermoascus crustaceus TaxID=5088 RepID=UPI0037433D14
MASILPEDILILITDQIEARLDRLNLASCSRRFYHLLQPHVYKSIILGYGDDARLSPLVHTIARNPTLAQAVLHLTLHIQYSAWACFKHKVQYDPILLNPIVKMYSHSNTEWILWERALKGDMHDSWVALLLPQLPNLQSVETTVPFDSELFDRMLERATTGQKPFDTKPAFSSLIDVSVLRLDTVQGLSVSEVMPLFRIPSVRHFTGVKVTEGRSTDSDDEDQPAPPPGAGTVTSSITEIDLRASNGYRGMRNLICACPNLQSFKYRHIDEGIPGHWFNPAAFGRSLLASSARASLESLWLDYESGEDFETSFITTMDDFVGSLAEFTALKHIHLRVQNLLHSKPLIEILPSSLESLCITSCNLSLGGRLPLLTEQLRVLIVHFREQTPGLVQLDIQGNDFFDKKNYPTLSKDMLKSYPQQPVSCIKPGVYEITSGLRAVCADAGIRFHVRDRYIEWHFYDR